MRKVCLEENKHGRMSNLLNMENTENNFFYDKLISLFFNHK